MRRRDVGRAARLLVSHGYRRVFARGPAWEAATCPFRHAHNFADDEGRQALDLHWKLSQSYFALALDPDRLWERLATVRVGGQEILTLAPEETLILLCMHGARHSWARLAWICDIAELVAAHPQMRWSRVLRQAGELRSMRALLLGLRLARTLLSAPLPDAIAHRIRSDPALDVLAAQVISWLFEETTSWTEIAQAAFYVQVRERWRDRVQYGPELLRIALAQAFQPIGHEYYQPALKGRTNR